MNKKLLISGIFITSLVIANVIAGKVIDVGGMVMTSAIVLYPVTFLMTDLMNELFGKKEAQKLVNTGFICAIFASIMIFIAQVLPVASFAKDTQEAYKILLGMNFRIVGASMLAYYISQTWDVWFFNWINRQTKGKYKWLRNNASTMTSQFVDTVIFTFIAFIGTVPNIWAMILSYYIIKIGLALVDTPLFYLLTMGTNIHHAEGAPYKMRKKADATDW